MSISAIKCGKRQDRLLNVKYLGSLFVVSLIVDIYVDK